MILSKYLACIALKIKQKIPETDISEIMEEVDQLLDESILAGEFIIPSAPRQLVDLTELDLTELKRKFQQGKQPRTQTEKLKGIVDRKLGQMLKVKNSSLNYYEKFQQMIENYNSGSHNIEIFFYELIDLAQELNQEEKRAILARLTEG